MENRSVGMAGTAQNDRPTPRLEGSVSLESKGLRNHGLVIMDNSGDILQIVNMILSWSPPIKQPRGL